MYSFFSLDSLQMADWIARHELVLDIIKGWKGTLQPSERGRPYRQWGELVAAQVEGLQLSPLVDAERQLGDLITAQVESLQASQRVEALRHPGQVITREVNI